MACATLLDQSGRPAADHSDGPKVDRCSTPRRAFFPSRRMTRCGWCECENCRRVEQEEGGAHSGPILRFVNAVAAEVGKTHPDKLIDTLAYWYSEPPPLKVRPHPNVRIRLCPIGACEGQPYDRCVHDRYLRITCRLGQDHEPALHLALRHEFPRTTCCPFRTLTNLPPTFPCTRKTAWWGSSWKAMRRRAEARKTPNFAPT